MIAKWPGELAYVRCPGWTMGQIVAKIEQVAQMGGLHYVMVDYLNKVRPDSRGQNFNYTQGRGSDIEDFKSCLERWGLVGFLGGQFDKDSKTKKRRKLSDLRDTGELDDKAQVGLVIDRGEKEDGSMSELCTIRVVKCNIGSMGPISMRMVGQRFLFTDDFTRTED